MKCINPIFFSFTIPLLTLMLAGCNTGSGPEGNTQTPHQIIDVGKTLADICNSDSHPNSAATQWLAQTGDELKSENDRIVLSSPQSVESNGKEFPLNSKHRGELMLHGAKGREIKVTVEGVTLPSNVTSGQAVENFLVTGRIEKCN